ncbi:MAG: GNAT family N-acetyltransferase [Rhizomicrobium sp.]
MTTIRPPRLPDDKPAFLAFIDGLQAFEHGFEPDRRLDATVAAEHFARLEHEIAEKGGAIFVAEGPDGAAVGWAVVHENLRPGFVVAAERRVAYIAELYLVEAARGRGGGRALIAACEDWARARGIGVVMIGVLAGNRAAHAVYAGAGYADYALELRKKLS